MSVFLHGIALSNYRGIGAPPVFVAPFGRLNFFIGRNNSGKSCVLNFIARHVRPMVSQEHRRHSHETPIRLDPLDVHLGATDAQVRMGMAIPRHSLKQSVLDATNNLSGNLQAIKLLDDLIAALCNGEEHLWVERAGNDKTICIFGGGANHTELEPLADARIWNVLWNKLTNMSGGDLWHHWIPETVSSVIRRADVFLPETNLIPAKRQISPKGEEFRDWSGAGLIEELARLQNPGVHERDRLEKFERINEFLKSVTENDSATIEIPHDREHVLVHIDGRVLPLESLGTGVHEVVMLAAFCTLIERQIVCMEEPEIHLHPLLQRRLVHHLIEQTDNQYFIATHSASVIDAREAAVFHVAHHDGKTSIKSTISSAGRFDICQDLGYKASDLLQSNAVIWVEGPSDRIYLRYWIRALAPDLREGIDYSIMFYGGRLLSHLTAEDPMSEKEDVEALIAIRQLNRNLAFVIDSDKDNENAPLNATKRRVIEELVGSECVAWVTAGREIENYIPQSTMTQALASVYSVFDRRYKTGQYESVLPFRASDGQIIKSVDKVRVARSVCSLSPDLNVLDLRERIESLISFIRSADT